MNGLIFLYPEGTLDSAKEMQDDWKVALAAKTAEWCQENFSSFVPVIGEWDVDREQNVPSLASLVNAKEEDLPAIYVLHASSF